MGSPIRLYQSLTSNQLAAIGEALQQELLTGTITSTGGAGKTGSVQVLPLDQRLQAYNLELQYRSGRRLAQKVTQVVNCNGYGAYGHY